MQYSCQVASLCFLGKNTKKKRKNQLNPTENQQKTIKTNEKQ
jgi:hypothetical protein